jgi:hypothetical protein
MALSFSSDFDAPVEQLRLYGRALIWGEFVANLWCDVWLLW